MPLAYALKLADNRFKYTWKADELEIKFKGAPVRKLPKTFTAYHDGQRFHFSMEESGTEGSPYSLGDAVDKWPDDESELLEFIETCSNIDLLDEIVRTDDREPVNVAATAKILAQTSF